MTKKVRAIVSGRVQGVWYRAHTRDKARELGLHGYVRNLADGDVEIVAQGEQSAVDALIDWSWTGPPMAQVPSPIGVISRSELPRRFMFMTMRSRGR